MNPTTIQEFVTQRWQTGILPALHEYIRIPNKSPHFDPQWSEHGHMDAAIDLLHAWAAGLPVIVSQEAGICSFADDREDVLMVAPDDEDALVASMDELSDNISLRIDISRKAYGEVAGRFGWDRIHKLYEQIYVDGMNSM